MLSSRTNWHRQPNPLALLLEERRQKGFAVSDLTISNPTEAGFIYPHEEILSALSSHKALLYEPHPLGLSSAREAVAEYYAGQGMTVDPSQILLTSGTSEAYSFLFTLLCDPGDSILVPSPSYPLFDYLAPMKGIELCEYELKYDGEWHLDWESLERTLHARTRAIVIINPHNPTGMTLSSGDWNRLYKLAATRQVALISDEVFAEYSFNSLALSPDADGASVPLHFILNGISKMCGLPQFKLGWIVARGIEKNEALSRLEIIADTFLSVNTAVQHALPTLLAATENVRTQIRRRTAANYKKVKEGFAGSCVSVLNSAGGWYAILKLPALCSEDEWTMRLLQEEGIYVYPGYFLDLKSGCHLVVSLLAEPKEMRSGIAAICRMAG